MNEEKIDDIIRKKLNNSIQVPNKIYDDVDKVLDSIKDQKVKHFKKNKILKIVATVLIVSIVGVTGYATINNNILKKLNIGKNDTNVEEISDEVLRLIENDSAKIEINKLVADDSYLILEYNVEIKEKLMNDYEKIQAMNGENIYLENVVKVKSQYYDDIELERTSEVEQLVEKTSDNTFSIYQTLMIADVNLPTEFNLDIEFENLDIGNSDEEHLIIGFGDFEVDTGLKNSSKVQQGEANTIESETDIIEEVNATDKVGEKVEIFVNLDKARENSKVSNVNKNLKINNNQTLKVSEYRETPITNFIKMEIVSTNVNSEHLINNTEKNPLNIILDIQDENGNSLNHKELKNTSYLKVKEGEDNPLDGEILEIDDSLDFKGATIKSEYIFALNDLPDDISKIKIVPLLITDEEENNDNTKWYPLKDGKYSFKNNVGGEIKVNEIKVNDNKLLFYYDKVGCMPQQDAELIIRANEEKYGYNRVFTSIYEKNSKIKNSYISGVYFNSIAYHQIADERIDLEDIIKNDIDNVEFSFRITSKINVLDEKGIEIDVK